LVSLNGVIQAPQDSFTVSGSQIIFDSALTSADVIDFIIALGDTLDIGVPSAGSVNTSQLANDAVTTAKIAAGQVTSAKLDTNIAITGDLTVDTNTLHVDSANNKVGLGIDPGTLPAFANHAILVSNGGGISVTSSSAGDNRYIFFGNGTSSSDIQLAAIQNTNSDLIFKGASGSEKMRILNAGGITFNGDTAAANALDDYEEGTWTANINFGSNTGSSTGATYGESTGNYVKIGNLVHVQCRISLTNKGSSTGSANITGLPFSSNGGGVPIVPFACWYTAFANVTRGQVVIGRIDNNAPGIELRFLDGNSEALLSDTHIANNSNIALSGTYYTTS